MSGRSFYGDLTPEEAWELLSSDPKARLVDVRTTPEWMFVGGPDLAPIGGTVLREEWQSYPSMQVDPGFVPRLDKALAAAGAEKGSPVLFLCRSGGRSAAAAAAMTGAGYERCFNIVGGFEGQRDEHGHRGTVEGWKTADLPWVQP